MRRKLLAATALALATAAAPANAGFILSFGGAPTAVGLGLNNYASQLADVLGVGIPDLAYVDQGASLVIDAPGTVTFYLLGAESGYNNSFWVDGSKVGDENNENWDDSNSGDRLLGSVSYTGTAPISITNWAFRTDGADGKNADLSQTGFGFFMNLAQLTGLSSNTLYIGYDDQDHDYAADDDNHDDFVLKAVFTPVPEAATWAMFLSGFTAIGAAMRRRSGSFRSRQAV